MKIATIITIILASLPMVIRAQHPNPILRMYEYDIDNNMLKLDKKFQDNSGNLFQTNVFVRYSKNPRFTIHFRPDQIMYFRLRKEQIFQTRVDKNHLRFEFKVGDKWNTTENRLSKILADNGKFSEKKIKKKDYELIKLENSIVFIIDPSTIDSGDIIRIYWQSESLDFNSITVESPKLEVDFEQYLSINLPVQFEYQVTDERLKLVDVKLGRMILKKFTYNVQSMTVDVPIESKTYEYEILKSSDTSQFVFPLVSIELPLAIGTTIDEILQK